VAIDIVTPVDALIIDRGSIAGVDPAWAIPRYRVGMVVAAVNVHADSLGGLLARPELAARPREDWDQLTGVPNAEFFTVSAYRPTGSAFAPTQHAADPKAAWDPEIAFPTGEPLGEYNDMRYHSTKAPNPGEGARCSSAASRVALCKSGSRGRHDCHSRDPVIVVIPAIRTDLPELDPCPCDRGTVRDGADGAVQ
jgi:hypothetical protein